MQLDSTQRKRLRGLAHALRPAVHVGARGLTEAVTRQIDEALERHELIKVKIAAEREQRQRMAEQIVQATGAALAGLVGRIAILYRRHPDRQRRRIALG